MDRAFDRRTDLAVLRTEARLKTIYKQASKEITDKMQTWQKGHEKRDKMYRQMVEDGKMSKDDYDAWMRGQVFQGEQWAARKAQIDNVLYNAENAAAKIVNENRIGVFTQNANRIGYELEHSGGVDIGFTLYDEATVSRLLKDNPRMLPPAKVQKPKAYSYYNRLVNNCVTQGIIQGESIDQIADRIVNKTGEASYSSAVRNARTSMTGAQNAGRIEGLHQAQELGVKVKKQWLATLDDHTRDAHRDLDGQIRDVDEPFEVNGLKIDYPGDPNADPSLVYNCRCTLTYKYPEYPDEAVQRRDNETGELIEDMTYREWEQMKGRQVEYPEIQTPIEDLPPIDRIRRRLSEHEGGWSTNELQEVGADAREYILTEAGETAAREQARLEAIKEANTQRRIELRDQMSDIEDRIDLAKAAGDEKTAEKLARQYRKLKKESDELLQTNLKIWDQIDAIGDGKSYTLRELLAQVRPMGGITEDNIAEYANLNRYTTNKKKTQEELIKAMNCYPTAWLNSSKDSSTTLKPHWTTGRAYYHPVTGEIRIRDKKSTNVHELGHRYEYTVEGIMAAERDFYERRTAGEPLRWLGPGYSRDETTRRDQFVDPYMGKDYGGDGYELVSMGFQFAHTDYSTLERDPDMESWILGIMFAL